MSIVLYSAGLIAGVSVFLYIYSLVNRPKEKAAKKNRIPAGKTSGAGSAVKKHAIATIPPGERMCPLCRSTLSKSEPLYASRVEEKGEGRILILGCRYCYKDD